MNDEIGNVAGSIWTVLHARGELTLTALKKEVGASSPLFDWAIGWLARENNLAITKDKRTYRVGLR
jgi:hypothetical protein